MQTGLGWCMGVTGLVEEIRKAKIMFEQAETMELVTMNMWLKWFKQDDKRVTHESGGIISQIDC